MHSMSETAGLSKQRLGRMHEVLGRHVESGDVPGLVFPAFPPDELMRRYGTLPLVYQPGERWLYNTGTEILGVLIGRVAGTSLAKFLHERIFAPLGMKDTAFSVPQQSLDRLATV